MRRRFYRFYSNNGRIFFFTSVGKKRISKVVEFTSAGKGFVSVGFGDISATGSVDDMMISGNGDARKVLATVVQVILLFSAKNPELRILFTGSSPERTKFYNRVLELYQHEFTKRFVITMRNQESAAEKIYSPGGVVGDSYFFLTSKI